MDALSATQNDAKSDSKSLSVGARAGAVIGGAIGVVGSAVNWAVFGSIIPDDSRNDIAASALKDGINSIKSGLSGK